MGDGLWAKRSGWELVPYNPTQVLVHRDVLCIYFSSQDCCDLIERSKTTTPSLSVMKIRTQTKIKNYRKNL